MTVNLKHDFQVEDLTDVGDDSKDFPNCGKLEHTAIK